MPDFWAHLTSAVLTVYFLANLLARHEGPAGWCLRLRVKAGGYDLAANGQAKTRLGRFIVCPYCWGTWLALPVGWVVFGHPWLWLAVVGGQWALQGVTD